MALERNRLRLKVRRRESRSTNNDLLKHADEAGSMEMGNNMPDMELRLTELDAPPAEFRAELGQRIDAFHSETVPFQSSRFGLTLTDPAGELAGGLSGAMSWGWLFINAVWVRADQRGKGAGRRLMEAAERRAAREGCHSIWLDTFQARGFYEALGYQVFGTLENYPAAQTRYFLRKPVA
jgi:GNAT superfamily N-acetyltransferase